MRPSKSATLLEVAKLAGVSTATVNRAIKQQGYVSREAREKVMAAVEATNYALMSSLPACAPIRHSPSG